VAGPRQRPGAPIERRGALTGLLGGSFNPAHGGHRRISLFAKARLGLDELWWLVTPGNPLKPAAGRAPLAARVASAQAQARRAPIRVTAIERELATRYTVETLRRLRRRYARRRFVWLMGADNLAQFHRWRDWRGIALTMPIAVIARPGYDAAALAAPAMAWLRRYRRRPEMLRHSASWSVPALILLRFDPDVRSSTEIRAARPGWADPHGPAWRQARLVRDQVTHRLIPAEPR
jgi:nicotinate-nucleotide adenylyltransferase